MLSYCYSLYRKGKFMTESKVYFTKDISSDGLIKVFNALNIKLNGKTAVKISTGEPGGHNFLNPKMIKPLVDLLQGTIVECNTAYPGKRNTTKAHWQTIKDHGFFDIAPCDIMDEDGEISIPVKNGFQLKENIVGSHLKNYNSMLMLSHFKGHMMGGFGGALKNMSIGIASSKGKIHIHTAGKSKNFDDAFTTVQDHFLEAMADADSSVVDFIGKENMAYINVANRLSIDCDCDSNPAEPEMADIGIFASTDPVALDQACVDAVYNSPDEGKKSLIKRMEERHGIHTVETAEKHGLGSRIYEIVNLD